MTNNHIGGGVVVMPPQKQATLGKYRRNQKFDNESYEMTQLRQINYNSAPVAVRIKKDYGRGNLGRKCPRPH